MATPTPEDRLRAFGGRVRELRKAKGLSQEELGERADLHRNFVGMLERGERNPTLVTLFRLADGLGVPPADLIG